MLKLPKRILWRFSTAPIPPIEPNPSPKPQQLPFIKRIIPSRFHPYVELGRYDKPIGYMLLFWPCAWGLSFATPLSHMIDYLVFLAGSISMRAAGCIINDMSDKDFDKDVERTKNRPLASGKLTKTQAALFLIPNLSIGLLVLTQLTPLSIAAAFGIIPVVIAYPLMKRYTNYPQVVLGTAFNWGVIVGYLARSDVFLPQVIIPAYLAGILWTLVYDTIYAFQDIEDDERIGVKSTARTWKHNFGKVMQKLIAVSGGLLVLSGIGAQMPFIYFPLIMMTHYIYFYWMKKVNLKDRAACGKAFRHSNYYGLAIAIVIYLCNQISETNLEVQYKNFKQNNEMSISENTLVKDEIQQKQEKEDKQIQN